MDSSPPVKLKNLDMHGPISVEEIAESDNDKLGWGFVILLMGPKGSGKSTFIKTLSLNGATNIELPSATQSIIPYRIKNVTWREHAVHIVDVPGFAYTEILEMKIVSLLSEWMKNAGIQVFYHIIYFTPITFVGLPGSRRQMLKTFRSITGVGSATNVTVATTMWDTIRGEAAAKWAEGTFNQLRDDTWVDYIKAGSDLVRFYNTPESALSILDTLASRYNGVAKSNLEDLHKHYFQWSSVPNHMLTDLQCRFELLHSHVPTIPDSDHESALSKMLLASLCLPILKEAQQRLRMFEEELQESQKLPTPDGSDVVSQVHNPNIVATQISISDSESDVTHALTMSPGSPPRVSRTLPKEDKTSDGDGAPHVLDAAIVALQISPPDLDDDSIHGLTIISTGPPQSNPNPPEVLPLQGIFAWVMSWVKRSVNGITRRHVNEA
ncbi:hypothetical protein BJ165DRAFT_1535433 [Panaeolus papilionaceus]|nr:hypothetical protein BJ165DRAFT_1535433 [Panaeolus papilionaceus]